MNYKCGNAFYFHKLNSIGGVESHFYYMARKYGAKYDMMVFYRSGDEKQIRRISRYVRCVQLQKTDHITCDKIFVNYVRDVLDQCDAKERIFVIHADYKGMIKYKQFSKVSLPVDKRIDRYVGVSQLACDSWKELTGIEAENLYEPLVLDKDNKPLMFISATRLTAEKGWDRMVTLAKALDEAGVRYTWLVYTNTEKPKPSKNMIFCEPRLDIADQMQNFDAFIQLSDNEGFCLSVVEALMMGIPAICTDLPVLRELGLNDSNSIRLDMEMKSIPINRIKDIYKLDFNYSPPEDRWDGALSHVESTYDPNALYDVKATDMYQIKHLVDANLGYCPAPGSRFKVTYDRLVFLLGANKYHQQFVELIDENNPFAADI